MTVYPLAFICLPKFIRFVSVTARFVEAPTRYTFVFSEIVENMYDVNDWVNQSWHDGFRQKESNDRNGWVDIHALEKSVCVIAECQSFDQSNRKQNLPKNRKYSVETESETINSISKSAVWFVPSTTLFVYDVNQHGINNENRITKKWQWMWHSIFEEFWLVTGMKYCVYSLSNFDVSKQTSTITTCWEFLVVDVFEQIASKKVNLID